MDLKTRFLRHVEKTEFCWLWTGCRTKRTDGYNYGGYGKFGSGGKYGKSLLAHRAAWMIFIGEIPVGEWVLHKCDNPLCVRPDHLFLGDAKTNMQDMLAKGRASLGPGHARPIAILPPVNKFQQCGEDSVSVRLTTKDVLAIRNEYKPWVNSLGKLAKKYHVGRSTIQAIIERTTWTHI